MPFQTFAVRVADDSVADFQVSRHAGPLRSVLLVAMRESLRLSLEQETHKKLLCHIYIWTELRPTREEHMAWEMLVPLRLSPLR